MQQHDLTVEEAAERFEVTVRTIFRIMRRCRDASLVDQEELVVFAAD
jgi:predicted DNA-binding transcriptional regulator YafY|tara:strand:- start:702 stop:842 length:141 start_codon:yes stop_codon:yes gene_type:complete